MTNKWLPLLISLFVLFGLNILMVSSLAPSLLGKQLVSWTIGLVLLVIGTQINPKQVNASKALIYIVSTLLLLSPILLNNITRGSRRWIDIGPLSIQPSEIVKPWLLLFLVNSRQPLLILIPVAIVMIQPDLGSALSILLLLSPLLIYNKKFALLLAGSSLVLAFSTPILWRYVFHDYQKQRIINFLNPNADPLGSGYNVIQSKIAIGSGGIWGKGYRKGTQGQLLFLPEKHTDFMFAATAEELGLVGIILIIAAYYVLISTLINKSFNTSHNFPLQLFTLGIAIQIWAQCLINIGMNIGLLPVTGIPLPFLSVGGSSIMALLFSLGIIYSG